MVLISACTSVKACAESAAPDTSDNTLHNTLDTSQPSASPTPLIVFDVNVDFNSGARPVSEYYEIGEDENNNQYDLPNDDNPQDPSFNPVFVSAYYYPWHTHFMGMRC